MPKSAYDDLMQAVGDYEKSGAGERDREKKKKEEEERHKRMREEERKRREAEGKDATGARVRRGYDAMQEMRDAASKELKAKPYKDRRGAQGGVRG